MIKKEKNLLTLSLNWNGILKICDCLLINPEYFYEALEESQNYEIYEAFIGYREALENKNIDPISMASISVVEEKNIIVYINIVKALNPAWKAICEYKPTDSIPEYLWYKTCQEQNYDFIPEKYLCQNFVRSLPYAFLLDRPFVLESELFQIKEGITNEYFLFSESCGTREIIDPNTILNEIQKFQKEFSLFLNFNGNLIVADCFVISPIKFWRIKDKHEFIEAIRIFDHICQNSKTTFADEIYRSPQAIKKLKIKVNFSTVLSACKHLNEIGLKRFEYSISSDGAINLFNCLYVHSKEILMFSEKFIDAARKLRSSLGNEEFSCEFSPNGIYDNNNKEKFHKENYIEYGKMLCAFIEETEPNMIVEYKMQERMFIINNFVIIHPRSMIHLQDLPSFLQALKDYTPVLGQAFDKEKFLNDPRIKDLNESIHKNERIQLIPKREQFLEKLGKLLSENITFLDELNIKHNIYTERMIDEFSKDHKTKYLHHDNQRYQFIQNQIEKCNNYNIESVIMQGYYIFDEDIYTLDNTLDWESEFNENLIKVGLKLAKDYSQIKFDEGGSKKVLLFNSLINFVDKYVNHYHKKEKIKSYKALVKKDSDCYDQMLIKFKECLKQFKKLHESGKYSYHFGSLCSAIHHYYKHGIKLGSTEDYYNIMNDFFESQRNSCVSMFYSQDGQGIKTNYENNKFLGVLFSRITKANDYGNVTTIVATFRKVKVVVEDKEAKRERQKIHQENEKRIKEQYKGKVYLPQTLNSVNYRAFSKNFLLADSLLKYYQGLPQIYKKGTKKGEVVKSEDGGIKYDHNKGLKDILKITVNWSDKTTIAEIAEEVKNYDFEESSASTKIENIFLMLGTEMLQNNYEGSIIIAQTLELCEALKIKLPNATIFLLTFPLMAAFKTKAEDYNRQILELKQERITSIDLAAYIDKEFKKSIKYDETVGLIEEIFSPIFTEAMNNLFTGITKESNRKKQQNPTL